MINFLQINLRKSSSARAMMDQTVRELKSDVLLLSEIPRDLPDITRCVKSSDRKSAVVLSATARLAAIKSGKGPGFACMTLPTLLPCICYWKPGCLVEDFEHFLTGLECDIRRRQQPCMALLVVGDFNAKFPQ